MLGTFSSNLLRGGKHTNCNTENSIQAGKFPFFLWWPRLSAEAVQAPSLHIFQRHPGTALSSLRLLPAPATRSVGSCFTLRSWKMSTINMNFIGFSPSPAPGQVSGVPYTLLLLSWREREQGCHKNPPANARKPRRRGRGWARGALLPWLLLLLQPGHVWLYSPLPGPAAGQKEQVCGLMAAFHPGSSAPGVAEGQIATPWPFAESLSTPSTWGCPPLSAGHGRNP